ncbi:hypothetical protein, partial [Paenibacillus campinasensis]|uniref:hypothetical protein n=1 Tax=Paenibacillus campinasensis TaxID=66347 RepID=UPI001E5BC0AF
RPRPKLGTDAAPAFGFLSGSGQQLLTLETPNPPSGGLLEMGLHKKIDRPTESVSSQREYFVICCQAPL